MRVGPVLLSGGMLGVGAMMQAGGLYDLGEAVKPIEDLANGAAKAGTAVAAAVGNGAEELPTWLLAFALVCLVIRFVTYSPTGDKIVQGRNERQQNAHAVEMSKLAHAQEMERLRLEAEIRQGKS